MAGDAAVGEVRSRGVSAGRGRRGGPGDGAAGAAVAWKGQSRGRWLVFCFEARPKGARKRRLA